VVAATTQPAGAVQYVGVFSQPRSSLAKWKARGVNVLIGSEPEARADGTASVSQAEWRAAARAVPGGGLPYYDRPSANPEEDAKDPYLLGFLMDDEVDRRIVLPAIDALKTEKDPARRAALQKTIDDCVAGYKAIADRCRATGKPVLGNFSGPQVTGGYPWYAGQGQLPFLPLITEEASDWYVVNAKAPPYPVTLVGQQLDLLAQWRKSAKLPAVPQWCFLECFLECGFMNKGGGRAPTDDELDAEVAQATARGVKGIVWFPQRFNPFAYDGLTAAEAERLTRVNARLLRGAAQPATLPTTAPATQPSELDAVKAENAQLKERTRRAAELLNGGN
jgi:hypothetical protein